MTSSASPTVRRRRLAAELRRLRGSRTGTTVAKALGWSPAKVSRYELGQGSFPLEEIEKLLDYYGVIEPRRAQLLALAVEANERAWWDDYADALTPQYMEFIGLEAEAASEREWQVSAIPGLLQTKEYARAIHSAHQQAILKRPGVFDRRVAVRMIRQEVLTARIPPLELSVVIDQSVLLRKVGSREVMAGQLHHLVQMARLPNVDLRILPLEGDTSLMADSFLILGFSPEHEATKLGDVVTTEGIETHIYIDGETDTYPFSLFFHAFVEAALSPDHSRELILETTRRLWGSDVADLGHGSGGPGRDMTIVTRAADVIEDDDNSGRAWRRSRRSYGSGACLEAASDTRIHIRDSKNPGGVVLRFTAAQWNGFVAGVRSGSLHP